MKKFNLITIICLCFISWSASSQVSGTVFRDYNGNGIKDANEPFVSGVTINAYNNSETLCGSAISAGNTSPNYTLTGCGTGAVRVEFIVPSSGTCANSSIDFPSLSGSIYGSTVQFVNGNSSNVNFAINNPNNYNTGSTGVDAFVPIYTSGNPLGGGTSGTGNWFAGFPYTNSGTTTPAQTLNGTSIGTTWGTAYSKQAKKIFTSAFVKRHSGLGTLGSGGIYLLTPTASSFTVSNFYDLDANGHRTRAATGSPSYGNGSSFQISGTDNNIITYLGSTDALTGEPSGLGVVGVNGTGGRNLPASGTTANFDPAAFGQVGKVGLGSLEISDDGKFLFVMNLYSRKIFRLELNDAKNPTSVINVTSYDIPTVTCGNGKLRPFALKYSRGKLFIGAVCSGENGGQNVVNGATDLYAYVFEMTDPTGTPSVNSSPVITFPLNYLKGAARPLRPPPYNATQWFPWTNNTGSVLIPPSNAQGTYPTPMLTDLDFSDRGDLIMSFTDRGGHSWGFDNYQHLSGSTALFQYIIGGDILTAGVDCNAGTYTLENNASITSNGTVVTSSGGVGNNEGPGGGEFFNNEFMLTNHNETHMGSLLNIYGLGEVFTSSMDPTALNSGGIRRFSTSNGTLVGSGYQLYGVSPNYGKANGLGEVEYVGTLSPTEIGNRVWNDTDGDGVQDADEAGIANVCLEIFADFNNDGTPDGAALGTTSTNTSGNYYFNNANIADGDPTTSGNQPGLQSEKTYVIRVCASDWTGGVGAGDLVGKQLTSSNSTVGIGVDDEIDNDADLVATIPQISATVNASGQNNHSLDFGFKTTPTCAAPTAIAASVTAPTCTGATANNNGKITVTAVTSAGDKYGVSSGASYTGPAYAAANTLTLPQDVQTAIPNTGGTYTIRIFNTADACFKDTTITVAAVTCSATCTAPSGITTSQTAPTCTGATANNNGKITITAVTNFDKYGVSSGATYTGPAYAAASVVTLPQDAQTAIPNTGGTYTIRVFNGSDACFSDVTITLAPVSCTAPACTDTLKKCPSQTAVLEAADSLTGYQWYTISGVDTLPIAGATNQTYSTTANGTYIFKGTDGNGCTAMLCCPVVVADTTNCCGSVEDYVWNDTDGNGLNNEPASAGINGVTVELWKETSPGSGTYALAQTGVTANNGSGDPGYYTFTVCDSASYKVKFPTFNGANNLTTQDPAAATNDNSDPNPADGFSPAFTINPGGSGVLKDNNTIDAGYAPAAPLNNLGDFVWLDNNKDGIQDQGEPGVANIPVSLYANGTDGLPCTTDDILIASTTTDAYGKYLFTNLPDGNYNVGFTLPSNYKYTSTTGTSDTNPTNSDPDSVKGRTATINLAGGETELDVDAGIIFTTPPALSSLGDKVWYDTNGDGIQDSNESGIAGITVTLCDAATGKVVALTTTDANGNYIFTDLANGDYKVGFSPKPGTIFTQNNGGTTPGNTTTNSDADPVTGKTGTVSITAAGTVITGIDAGFKNDPKAGLGDLVWNDLNHDGKQDPGEPGVPGVTMKIYSAGADSLINGVGDVLIATAVTDANGNYWFPNLDPGVYFVTCNPVPGYTLTGQNVGTDDLKDNDFGTNAAYPGVGTTSQVYIIKAGDNNPSVDKGIYNSTPNLGSIGDKVWFDTDGDGIQDPSEMGVSGVTVCLLDGSGALVNNPATGAPYVLQTDANGNYSFEDLVAGNYKVAFKNLPPDTRLSPTGAGTFGTDSDPNPATGMTGVIALSAGQKIVDVDAGIVPGIPSGKGSLGNLVWIDANNDGIQDAGEQGVPGVQVDLCADANGDGIINGAEATTPVATQHTDAQGFYIFPGLDAGTYQVKFITSSFPAGYALQSGKNDQGTNDALDSDPNPSTGVTGLYVLSQGEDNMTVDAGLYNTTATNSVGDKVWLDQNSDGLQTTGEPGVPGVPVSLLDATGKVVATTVTDANGMYHFGNLPNGSYCVKVSAPAGFNVTTKDAGANANDATDSDIDPTTGKTSLVSLTGNTNITDLDAGLTTTRAALGDFVWIDANHDGIQDATEEKVAGVTVCLTRPGFGLDGIAGNADDALPLASAITDGNGFYFFSNLEPGTYDIEFKTIPSGLIFTTQNVTTPNDATDSDVDPATGKITGVTLAAGQVDPTNDAGLTPNLLGSVGDCVWFDENRDGIRDITEEPVAGVTVVLKDNTGNVIGTAITNGNGKYLFEDVIPGTGYTITFSNLPPNALFTTQGVGPTSTNSDANVNTGTTAGFDVVGGQKTPNIDAGIYKVVPNNIGNFVWLDDNKNGVQDLGEPGVANIPVTLYGNGTDNLPCTADDIIIASTITDAYGAYLFENLPDGNYNVGFALPANYEFTSTTGTSDTNPTNSDADTAKGRTATINLAGGETELDVDAGIIFSTPPALSSLGDYVWYDTNGDGIQDANEPGIAGVTVTLCDATTGNVIALTTTDADGKYIFNDLANGNYKVGFTPKPGTIFTQSNGGTTPGNATTNSDADPLTGKTATVSITAAGTVIEGIDAGFKDDPKAGLGDLVWNDLNHDGLQTPGEPGVPGVTMTLYLTGADTTIGGPDDVLVATTTTDANGNYWFSNLEPGRYFVTCSPVPGYVLTTQDVGTNDLKDNDFGTNAAYPGVGTSSQTYNLLAGQNYPGVDKGIYNATPSLGSVGDKVWLDSDGDGIQDPTEPGVSGVTVCLLDGTGAPVNNPATGEPYVLQTDANGNYTFNDLPAGNYQVKFKNIPAGTSLSPSGLGTAGTDSDPDPITGTTPTFALAAGQNKVDVDAGIVPGIPAGKGSLGNFVWIDANNNGIQDAGEQGVADVQVDLCADANGDGLINGAEATTPVATTHTDPQGYYIFTGLDANTYQVKFITSTFPAAYTLQAGKNDQGSNDAKDSDPNPSTGITGLYVLAQGEDNMTVDAGLYNTTATNSVGDKVWLDQNANGIQDSGEPGVPGVAVNLLDAAGEVISTTVTDANGNYHFGNLPNGSYCVKVTAPNGFAITTPNAGANDAADSDIDTLSFKTPLVSLTGNTNITDLDAGLTTTRAALGDYVWIDANMNGIQDPTEEPVSGVTACLLRPGFGADGIANNADDALPVASAITDANGFYFFSNLLPGTYDVLFKTIPSGMQFTTQNVTTPNDATDSDVDPLTGKISGITLAAGQVDPTNDAGLTPSLLGSVGDIVWFDANLDGIRDANEALVPGAIVTLKDPSGNVIGTAITDGNGQFLFENLLPGTGYTLTFSNLPTGSSITQKGIGATATNSDADPGTGITDPFVIVGGQKTPNIDAGITVYLPLPVVIKDFNVSNTNCNVTVSWTTISEQNVSHFNVMRKEAKDLNFNAIAKVKAKGNSSIEQSYSYKENDLAKGNYSYYIETVDIDTKKYGSNIKAISVNCETNSIAVYPNPFADNIYVKINSQELGEFEIKVTDMTGRTMLQTSTVVDNATKIVLIPTTTFAAGLYQVSVTNEKGTQTFRVQKSK